MKATADHREAMTRKLGVQAAMFFPRDKKSRYGFIDAGLGKAAQSLLSKGVTPGGTVDLRSGVLASADPADLITKLTYAAPSGGEDCPRWLQFLDEAMQGDAELIRFLKQFCGYSLTGVVREHVLASAHGDGGNGKSTFVKVVGSILNDYATVAPMESLTETKAPRHETEIARLVGKRLVTASETTRGSHWNDIRFGQSHQPTGLSAST
jgi:putative DNA primase/helicase